MSEKHKIAQRAKQLILNWQVYDLCGSINSSYHRTYLAAYHNTFSQVDKTADTQSGQHNR